MDARTRTRTIVVAAMAAVATSLLMVVVAQAKTIKHTGTVAGDPGAQVTLTVKKGKKLKQVKGFTISNLLLDCGREGEIRATASLGSAPITGKRRTRKGEFSLEVLSSDERARVRGTVKRKGAKVSGDFTYDIVRRTPGIVRCRASGEFKTSK